MELFSRLFHNTKCQLGDSVASKSAQILGGSHGLPELIAIAVVVLLHLWKRQMLLSIAAGTVSYMLLVQFVF